MENILKRTPVIEQRHYSTEISYLSRQSYVFFAVCQKVKQLFTPLRDFVVCHNFYEGEITRRS